MSDAAPRVLVTGAAGYAGSALVHQLLARGSHVRGVDILRFGGESLLALLTHPRFEFVRADVCDGAAMAAAFDGVDAVVHLAAIVGDPACACEPELAVRINRDASRHLYELACAAGVARFVFVSTCSNYGRTDAALIGETGSLAPLSLYAETKVDVERFLAAQPRTNRCQPVILRFATAYGLSGRPRFDLTVNEFARELALGRELVVYSADSWRPYCHVHDLARAVVMMLDAAATDVAFEVFNVGDTSENYSKRMLVDLMQARIPGSRVRIVGADGSDRRSYRVGFDKLARLGFRITRRVADGVDEIVQAIRTRFLADPDSPRFTNAVPFRLDAAAAGALPVAAPGPSAAALAGPLR